jgi:hypothetical protein
MPQGILQPIATGLMAGQQAYQGSLDRQTQEQINAARFAETKRQMDVRKLLPELYTETTDEQGNKSRTINRDVFQRIALENPDLAKQISEGQISARKAGLLPGMESNAPSPFAPYLQATSPQVRTMAAQLDRGFSTGVIDEETAYKRIEALARMEDQYLGRQESKADRELTRSIASQGKDATKGQKGFDNEMSLKKSFAAEPVYKAFNEMQSAYGQIADSLASASPAGDLAAATKFMKLLDPGSVVRESELGMAMAASGALDRAANYAQMRINGTKLTETQRADFKRLSDALFGTATNAYNSKRGEFEEMGSAYGLDAKRALGAPAKMPKSAGMPSQSDIDAEIERRRKARQ